MIQRLESFFGNINFTPFSWIVGISGILMVRFFLESISSHTSSGIIASDSSTLIHYFLFFISFALFFILFVSFLLPKWKKIAPALTLYSFIAIFISPILDFILTRGKGMTMSYLFNKPHELLNSFTHFFGPIFKSGITLGIRIEVLIILLSVFVISFLLYKNIFRAFITSLLLYISIFAFLSLPSLIAIGNQNGPLYFLQNSIYNSSSLKNNIHGALIYSSAVRMLEIGFNFLISRIWFFVTIFLTFLTFLRYEKQKTISILKNSRPERVVFHLMCICLGMAATKLLFPPEYLNWNDVLSVVTLLISFYFSWMFAVCINDIADRKIDAISNKDRPLIKNNLTDSDMNQAAFIFLALSLIGAFLAGYYAFFMMLSFSALYYIYSAPPTRFKTIPLFSSFLISLCILSEFLAGFFTISQTKNFTVIPPSFIFGIVILVTLWANIRDLKDIQGDSAEGIKTVPVLFGNVWGKRVVGIMAGSVYIIFPFFFGIQNNLFKPLLLLGIPFSLATYYFCVRENYSEKYLFGSIYLFVILCLVFIN